MPKALQLPDSLASTSTFTIKESVLLCNCSGYSTPLCSGQFWPGLEMGRIGLSDVFFLPINHEYEGSFVMTQKTLLDKEDIPCQKVSSLMLKLLYLLIVYFNRIQTTVFRLSQTVFWMAWLVLTHRLKSLYIQNI